MAALALPLAHGMQAIASLQREAGANQLRSRRDRQTQLTGHFNSIERRL